MLKHNINLATSSKNVIRSFGSVESSFNLIFHFRKAAVFASYSRVGNDSRSRAAAVRVRGLRREKDVKTTVDEVLWTEVPTPGTKTSSCTVRGMLYAASWWKLFTL